MNRIVGKYGGVLLTCLVVAVVLGVLENFADRLWKKADYREGNMAENVDSVIKTLSENGKYPYFEGDSFITLTYGYKGVDGKVGVSREDALEFVNAFQYDNFGENVEVVSKDKIKIYPFDEPQQTEEVISTEQTGKYVISYAVEDSHGLQASKDILVLVDFLPKGEDYKAWEVEDEVSH